MKISMALAQNSWKSQLFMTNYITKIIIHSIQIQITILDPMNNKPWIKDTFIRYEEPRPSSGRLADAPRVRLCGANAASGLQQLSERLAASGMGDINFLIVNAGVMHARTRVDALTRRVTFPVYQDTPNSGIWNLLQAGKDDLLVYDKCGKLTFYVPFPDSLLRHSFSETAIMSTYVGNVCDCALHRGGNQLPGRGQQSGRRNGGHHHFGVRTGGQQSSTHTRRQHPHRHSRRQRRQRLPLE
ncbi:hypothetical protein ScPMuIL_006067 [Solemya velum]